jgi:hypothetical protein
MNLNLIKHDTPFGYIIRDGDKDFLILGQMNGQLAEEILRKLKATHKMGWIDAGGPNE